VSGLFESGRIIDAILVLVAAEAAVLVALHLRTGRGPAPSALLSNLAAGLFLLLALRAALADLSWVWVALPLAAALAAHVSDQRLRFRG